MRLRPELLGVTESPMVQIATLAESMPGALKLCYGESDLATPEFICRAASDAMGSGHTFYTHTAGYTELREAIARQVHTLHGVTYRPSEIMSTVGGTMAIYAAIRAYVGRGDNAIVVSPAYAIFRNAVIMSGGEARLVPLQRCGSGFQLDIERVRAAIDDGTRMVIVNSPSNPTGWMITEAEQQSLLALAEAHGLTILADEVYERLTFDRPIAPSFARLGGDRDQLIVVNSFSKTYNMTGWRLGWAQAGEATIRTMSKAVEFMTSNPSAMVQQAGIVALRHGEPYVHDLRQQYAARRSQVQRALAGVPGVMLPEPAGAFYAFPHIEGLEDSTAFATALVRETGVALAPGAAFGEAGEGYVRLCFAATEQTLAPALSRFAEYVSAWSERR